MRKFRRCLSAAAILILASLLLTAGCWHPSPAEAGPGLSACLSGTALLLFLFAVAGARSNRKQK